MHIGGLLCRIKGKDKVKPTQAKGKLIMYKLHAEQRSLLRVLVRYISLGEFLTTITNALIRIPHRLQHPESKAKPGRREERNNKKTLRRKRTAFVPTRHRWRFRLLESWQQTRRPFPATRPDLQAGPTPRSRVGEFSHLGCLVGLVLLMLHARWILQMLREMGAQGPSAVTATTATEQVAAKDTGSDDDASAARAISPPQRPRPKPFNRRHDLAPMTEWGSNTVRWVPSEYSTTELLPSS
ncbi:hypothetical protein HPB51_011721 [Rhipicephalus microplus]|uniref:Uncharacterized protein n=1 Tax=Rhipicephalus microplus TaxID=6941 RepID=A0A9J6DMP0_RHIMP|nr:hypothetical protein HPB51_011721 [Rhipicephalus microplus]